MPSIGITSHREEKNIVFLLLPVNGVNEKHFARRKKYVESIVENYVEFVCFPLSLLFSIYKLYIVIVQSKFVPTKCFFFTRFYLLILLLPVQ